MRPQNKRSTPWVGEYADGKLVVFVRIVDEDHVVLWDVSARKEKLYSRKIARQKLRHVSERHKYLFALSDSPSCISLDGMSINFKNELAEYSHSARLRKLNIPVVGVSKTPVVMSTGQHREIQCWHCYRNLSGDAFLECAGCHWVICVCGACRCGKPSEEDFDYYHLDFYGDELSDSEYNLEEARRYLNEIDRETSNEIWSYGDDFERSDDEGWFYED